MNKQEINQIIEPNTKQLITNQIEDNLIMNPFEDNPPQTENPNLTNSTTQTEHSNEQIPTIQHTATPTITTPIENATSQTPQITQHEIPLTPFEIDTTPPNNINYTPFPKLDKKTQNTQTQDTQSTRGIGISRFFLLVLGVLLLAVSMSHWLAEQIVYSINRGAERAKADVARELLASIPEPEQRIPWVVKKVAPSVVSIRVYTQHRIGDFGVGIGTGVIIDTEKSTSYILTNHHVIDKARLFTVQFSDGQTTSDVEVIGFDSDTDLAVLRIGQSYTPSIEWGDSQKINVGEQVVAIGNPFGLGNTVTSGIISSTERYNPTPTGSRSHEMLQTDAAINPGNSGGPLVNLNGELIGINTTIFSQNGGNQGIGFAIPSLLVKHVYNEIRKNGKIEHGWLGIIMLPTTEELARRHGWDIPRGVIVRDFTPFSPAREAGIKRNDILLKWGETEIRNPLHLSHLIVLARAGQTETIELIRNGETKKIQIKLGKRPISINSN
ncbi:MAG: trypsin-like peptidase domain-containing protein [Planctomycetaceae bacterium]|jgi:S1-C subfamily serine protease|nr:trypsin-like peptidase domain-containing protein [Planctomycetaceae bacterium]